jgi:hypothetical protein
MERNVRLTDEDMDYLATVLEDGAGRKIVDKLRRSQKRITVASAKAKGRNLQYEVGQALAEALGFSWSPLGDESEIASRPMGQRGADVILRGEARRLLKLAIECKAVKSFSFKSAMEQAKANAGEGELPVVMHRPFKDQVYAIFSLSDFIVLLKELVGFRKGDRFVL